MYNEQLEELISLDTGDIKSLCGARGSTNLALKIGVLSFWGTITLKPIWETLDSDPAQGVRISFDLAQCAPTQLEKLYFDITQENFDIAQGDKLQPDTRRQHRAGSRTSA